MKRRLLIRVLLIGTLSVGACGRADRDAASGDSQALPGGQEVQSEKCADTTCLALTEAGKRGTSRKRATTRCY